MRGRIRFAIEKNKSGAHRSLLFAESDVEMLAHHADNAFRPAPIAKGSRSVVPIMKGGIVRQGARREKEKGESLHTPKGNAGRNLGKEFLLNLRSTAGVPVS
jgi:hypothetical protein